MAFERDMSLVCADDVVSSSRVSIHACIISPFVLFCTSSSDECEYQLQLTNEDSRDTAPGWFANSSICFTYWQSRKYVINIPFSWDQICNSGFSNSRIFLNPLVTHRRTTLHILNRHCNSFLKVKKVLKQQFRNYLTLYNTQKQNC